MRTCRLAEPSTEEDHGKGLSIGGKPLTKRRAAKLVSVSKSDRSSRTRRRERL